MTSRKTKTTANPPARTDKEGKEYMADVTLNSMANTAAVVAEYGAVFGEQDINALIGSLRPRMEKVREGNLQQCERMLAGQALALQSIFMNLSRRAIKQKIITNFDTFLRLALKAQNQCRTTLETLAAIKNPPVIFARQANINHGNQQVNNGTPAPASRAEKIINQQNELLEVQHGGETLDTRTTGATIHENPAMATMEVGNRRTHI
jgi:hypothetical protein